MPVGWRVRSPGTRVLVPRSAVRGRAIAQLFQAISGLAPTVLGDSTMVSVPRIDTLETAFGPDELGQRRPATTTALDARLSVWGQAARAAAERRAEAMVEGSLLYVERVGRHAEVLRPRARGSEVALVDANVEALINLGVEMLPEVVTRSCRLLWVDPDRVRENLGLRLAPELEAARAEIRRVQALYRRRARLWQADQSRLDGLRDEIEQLRVPRCREGTPELVAKGLFLRHREDASGQPDLVGTGAQRIGPGQIARWIHQLDERLARGPTLSLAH